MKPELVRLGEEEHHRRHKNPSKNVLAHNKVLLHVDFKTTCIDGKENNSTSSSNNQDVCILKRRRQVLELQTDINALSSSYFTNGTHIQQYPEACWMLMHQLLLKAPKFPYLHSQDPAITRRKK